MGLKFKIFISAAALTEFTNNVGNGVTDIVSIVHDESNAFILFYK